MQKQYVRQLGILLQIFSHHKSLPPFVFVLKESLTKYSTVEPQKLTQAMAVVLLNQDSQRLKALTNANLRRVCKALFHHHPPKSKVNYQQLFGEPSVRIIAGAINKRTRIRAVKPKQKAIHQVDQDASSDIDEMVDAVKKEEARVVKTFLGKEEVLTDDELPNSDYELEDLDVDDDESEP